MDIQNNSIVTDADTDVLDSQITQISNDFAETYYFDNEQQEELEMLVAKCMKLGELYERKKWQAIKAQAVLEKDAIIQKLSDQLYAQEMKTSGARVLCETACELLDGYAHQDAMVILNDLEQAMKEPAND